MKKILIICFLFCLLISPVSLWGSPKIFEEYSHYFAYKDKTFTTGGNLKFSFSEIKASTNFNNYNFGISLFSDNYLNHFPCTFKMGNLSIGGFISKLKNPVLDSACDGFSSCYSAPSLISAELPTFTLFTKPLSYFLEFAYTNEDKLFDNFGINCAYTPEANNLSFSVIGKIKTRSKLAITDASGISLFNIEEKIPASWFSDLPYYSESRSFCLGNQLNFDFCDYFKSCFSIFFYNTPFGDFNFVYKTENKAEIKNFNISLSAYLNLAKNLITLDNLVLSPCTQIKSNFQYTFLFQNTDNYLKSGITFYSKIPLPLPASPDLKLGISSTLKIPRSTFQASTAFSFRLADNSDLLLTYCSSKLENSLDFASLKPSLSLSSGLYFSSNKISSQHYSVNLCLTLPKEILTATSSFSYAVKNHIISDKKIDLGFSGNFKYKKINVILKIDGKFCI